MIDHPPTGDLHLYLDHQLPQEHLSTFEEHVQKCVRCRQSLEDLRLLRRSVASAADLELPYGFELRLRRAINDEGSHDRRWDGVETIARNAVAVIACIVLILISLTGFEPSVSDLPAEPLITNSQSDSVAMRVLSKQTEISRDDLVYAVVSK